MGVKLVPSRCDMEIMPNTDVPFTACLLDQAGPVDITLDAIQLTVYDQQGAVVYFKSNGVGEHAVPAEGKTSFLLPRKLTKAIQRNTWTFEIRRIITDPDRQYVYIVGEIRGV